MISIITPVHKTSLPFLDECAASLARQTSMDFQWVLLANGGISPKQVQAVVHQFPALVDKVDIGHIDTVEGHGVIGALKRKCCRLAVGEFILELDADDILTEDCIETVAEAFRNRKVMFVYSDCFEFIDETWKPFTYSSYWGWKQEPGRYLHTDGVERDIITMKCFPPDANTMRRVEWAPNHVRAWRTGAYWQIGGHNDKLKTGDDHELVCRFYKEYGPEGFAQITKPLYGYRVHPKNSCRTDNGDVQAQVAQNYDNYYESMALKWAEQSGLLALDLGGRFDCPDGYKSVDRLDADFVCDLEGRWPFDDGSVGVLRGYHLLEHLRDPIHAMNEAYRVLAPGGVFFIEVPSTDGRGAWQDPTHVSFWNENSFWYYTRESHARYIRPEYKGRFQLSRSENRHWDGGIVVVRAELICLKNGYRTGGEVLL